MIVISRMRNESIQIGDNIQVTIIDIRGDKVRLGVELPRDMPLHRAEVYAALHQLPQDSVSAFTPPPPVTASPPPREAALEQTVERQRQTIERQEQLIGRIEELIRQFRQG